MVRSDNRGLPVIPLPVLEAFGLPADGELLAGGQGTSVRHGPAVLKPVDDADAAAWTAELLSGLNPQGFQVPRALPARDGRWVVDGWAASEYVVGQPGPQGRWTQILTAGRAFHAALAAVPRPGFLARRTDRWAIADRVAWQEAGPALHPSVAPLARSVLDLCRPVELSAQLVHGDLAGNVLFPPDGPPVILDFSPYWRPPAYADAIVVIDGMLWYEAEPRLVDAARTGPDFPQLLLRALLFRLIALNGQLALPDAPEDELASFARVLDAVRSQLSEPC